MNARVVSLGNHHSARRMRLKSSTPTSTYHQLMFYLSKFHTKQGFVSKYHNPPISFAMQMWHFKILAVLSFTSFCREHVRCSHCQFPARRTCSHRSAGHTISSVESQKGAIADERYSIENQKGAIAIDFVQR